MIRYDRYRHQMFVIRPDPIRPLLHARLHGFWTLETVDQYGAALGEAIDRRAGAGGRFGLLVDSEDYPIQAAPIVDKFTAMLSQWPPPSPDGPIAAVAIVTNGALASLQARRTFGEVVAIFQNRIPAADWLLQEVRAAENGSASGRSG